MDLHDTAREARFRQEVREWLTEHAPTGLEALSSPAALRGLEDVTAAKRWSRELAEAGYAGLSWPRAYGGQDAPLEFQAIFLEEVARVGAPQHLGVIGLGMVGPTLIEHGTDEQRRHRLPAILSADEIWCQGFSEPEAGSDLANVRTRAGRRGDRFVVNGQKIWSSFAYIADRCLLLTRTEPGSDGRVGLTMFDVDMRAPGVDARPLRELTGDAVFSEVFFDDVEISATDAVGSVGGGWQVAMTTLLHERGTLGFSLVGSLEATFRRVLALARDREPLDIRIRERIAREWVELQALKLTNARALTTMVAAGVPGPEGSVIKLRWSEANQRLTRLALDLHGNDALDAPEDWRYLQLRSRANTIEAGTSEILRSIVAERILGLPKSR